MPKDPFYMIMAWVLMIVFAFALGLIICSITQMFDAFGKIWNTLSFVLLPLSGAFFFVHSLPIQVQKYAMYIPMVNGTEMFRYGYFGDSIITYENVGYLIVCNLVMLLIGLIMVKNFSKGIEPQ